MFLFPRPSSRRAFAAILLAAAAAMLGPAGCTTSRLSNQDDRVGEELRARFRRYEIPPALCAANESLRAAAEVGDFYARREFRPVWSSAGRRLPQAVALLAALREAGAEGLTPSDYHLAAIDKILRAKGSASLGGVAEIERETAMRTDFDLLLSDAYFLFASHLAEGKVDQDAKAARWDGLGRRADLAALLQAALSAGDLRGRLNSLLPQHRYYAGLRRAYARYLDLAARGGWPVLSPGPDLKKGTKDPRLAVLRERLTREGYGQALNGSSPPGFDGALEAAVCEFQQRHSLPQTGAVDEATRAALNIPAAARARQIALNLERWRWLPPDLGLRYSLVDVSDFEMFVVDRGEEIMRMKIVAGTQVWPTPCFTSVMTDLVFNPTWLAPSRVLAKELVNYIKADPNYLPSNKMYLFRGWGSEEFLVDPKSIDLNSVTEANIDFHLVQMPGPLNVLGRLKFTHPNRYDIYLHDTPYQSDFGQAVRTFSHGCIRIARPIEFALYLLGDKKWTANRVQGMIDTNEEAMIMVKNKIPVHVFSGTAWPLEDGTIHFRPDLYVADPWLDNALAASPAAPVSRKGKPD